jgi:hypothetical protein
MFPFEIKLPEGQVGGALWIVVMLMTVANFMMAVFWIVIGWRAMKAHERLPGVLAAGLREPPSSPATDPSPNA